MMQQPYDPEQLQRDALLQQMAGGQPVNQTQPVGGGVKLAEPGTPNATLATPPPAPANTRADRNALGGYAGVGTMTGFNTNMDYGGDEKAANSMKNTFGRIASRYGVNQLDAVMADPDFQRFFPGAKKIDHPTGDKIDFGGMLSDFESGTPVGVVDVGRAFGAEGHPDAAWAWQDEANSGMGGASQGGGEAELMALLQGVGGPQQGGGDSNLDQILQQIQQLSEGGDDPRQREALLQLMGGQV